MPRIKYSTEQIIHKPREVRGSERLAARLSELEGLVLAGETRFEHSIV